MNYSFIFGLISIVAGLTPEMLKKLSEWSKVPSKANQSKHHAVFNMMKRGGFFDPSTFGKDEDFYKRLEAFYV